MNKVVIKRNEIDPILKIPRPCWLEKNWSFNKNPFDYFDELDRPYLENEEGRGRFTDDSVIRGKKFIFEENPTTNYFYVLVSTPFNFYEDGIYKNFIDENVLNDIKQGKCKFIFYMDDDGHWFGKLPYFTDDANTLKPFIEFIEKYNLKKDDIYFISHNCILEDNSEKYPFTPLTCSAFSHKLEEGEIIEYPLYVNYSHCEYILDDDYTFKDDKIEKLFLCYNNRIKPHRFYLFHELIKNNYLNDFLYSFKGEYVETYMEEYLEKIPQYLTDKNKKPLEDSIIKKFYEILPTTIETSEESTYPGDYYGQYLQIDDFEKTFFSIVTESEIANDTIYFSEKTIKPILAKHPFILISSPNSLQKLKSYGFKTFDKWWDESYDNCDYFVDRIEKVLEIIKYLKSKTKEELIEMRNEMKEVLIHNQKLLLEFDTESFHKVLKNIKFNN